MKVKNRSASVTGYTIPNLCSRVFQPGETQEVSEKELQQLMYQPGGKYIFDNNLQLTKEDRAKIEGAENAEQEYYYSNEDIKRIMNKGSFDEFCDMMDFAPDGVISIVKDYAVSLPLNSLDKIDYLKQKTGFDTTAVIALNKQIDKDMADGEASNAPARQRRVQPSKYNIVE